MFEARQKVGPLDWMKVKKEVLYDGPIRPNNKTTSLRNLKRAHDPTFHG